MKFIALNPTRGKAPCSSDKIKIAFLMGRNKYMQIKISIGKEIFDKLSIKDGDKINFFFEEKNKKIFLIKKSLNNIGYIVRPKFNCFTTLIKWNLFPITKENRLSREVNYDFYEDGVRFYYKEIQ